MLGIFQLVKGLVPECGPEENLTFILSFQSIWQYGLIVFGFHLMYLSKLVNEKVTLLRVLSILLFIAGIGYVHSNTLDLFIDDYEQMRSKVEAVFILPTLLGEFWLAIYLLVKGGKESDFYDG